MINIFGLTKKQKEIAEILWNCQQIEEVNEVIDQYGHDAELIKTLILIEVSEQHINSEQDCRQARQILSRF